MTSTTDYQVHPSRIKLYVAFGSNHLSPHRSCDKAAQTDFRRKETKAEIAQRLFAREQRRHARTQSRITRANPPITPPRSRSESISPPRRRARVSPARQRDAASEQLRREAVDERLKFLAEEEMSRSSADPFPASYGGGSLNIPRRFREESKRESRRDAVREVGGRGGEAPRLGEMGEEEYVSFIREGMAGAQRRAEVAAEERRRAERLERDRLEEVEREKEVKEKKRRKKRAEAEKVVREADHRAEERRRYGERWAALGDKEVESVELRWGDVPWPVYRGGSLVKEDIRGFLEGYGGGMEGLRKVVREAIRAFHPDRFSSRVLARVRDVDKERVREGMENCTRVLNELAAELRA